MKLTFLVTALILPSFACVLPTVFSLYLSLIYPLVSFFTCPYFFFLFCEYLFIFSLFLSVFLSFFLVFSHPSFIGCCSISLDPLQSNSKPEMTSFNTATGETTSFFLSLTTYVSHMAFALSCIDLLQSAYCYLFLTLA